MTKDILLISVLSCNLLHHKSFSKFMPKLDAHLVNELAVNELAEGSIWTVVVGPYWHHRKNRNSIVK